MNWRTVITGESFENWVKKKLASQTVSQGSRLDPFATSMRNFKSASENLTCVRSGKALPVRGGSGNQARTDLAAAGLVTSGSGEVQLTEFGEAVLRLWETLEVNNDEGRHELVRCLVVAGLGVASGVSPYVEIARFWREIMEVESSISDVIRNPEFLYLASFLNSEVDDFNPWRVSNELNLGIKSATRNDLVEIKSRFPDLKEHLDKLESRVADWSTRSLGRKIFCCALELIRSSPSERRSLVRFLRSDPEAFIGDFDQEKVFEFFKAVGVSSMNALVSDFCDNLERSSLQFSRGVIVRLLSSLCTKRFVILTGLSGSGKTKLAQAFAHWISPSEDFFRIIPVGADWTGNENILGYPDGLNESAYVTRPALDLILHAREHAAIPHFLILDEMNLSHVERYFADILSMIESEATICLHGGGERMAGNTIIPQLIDLPKNVFIVGTVNVDETTYMFSPKVLDRANVIEFRMDDKEMGAFLGNPGKPDLSKLATEGKQFGDAFVAAASDEVPVPVEVKERFDAEMLVFFKSLQGHCAEFGFRTAYEASRFVNFYKVLGDQSAGNDAWFDEAFDCVIFQKLLPKLHGSRAKLEPILRALWFLCVNPTASRAAASDPKAPSTSESDAASGANAAASPGSPKPTPTKDIPAGAPYPMSAEKIFRMWRLMMENGFASFAEA